MLPRTACADRESESKPAHVVSSNDKHEEVVSSTSRSIERAYSISAPADYQSCAGGALRARVDRVASERSQRLAIKLQAHDQDLVGAHAPMCVAHELKRRLWQNRTRRALVAPSIV